MARVVPGPKRAAIDPLKHSQPLGGALVFLGIARSMPVMHGSQGCASFAKALLTRHFREPVPLQTTAVTEVAAVLGAGDLLTATLDAISTKQRPDVIGVLTTGLTEVNGEDVAAELRVYAEGRTDPDAPLVVFASTPDFRGGLSDGWAAALEALMRSIPLPAAPQPPAGSQCPPGSRPAGDGQFSVGCQPPASPQQGTENLYPERREAAPSGSPAHPRRLDSAGADSGPGAAAARAADQADGEAANRAGAEAADWAGGAADPAGAGAANRAGGRVAANRATPPGRAEGLLAILAGPSLTAADLDELADMVRAFALEPVLVPDLSASLDGHLAGDWSPVTTGGTTVTQLRSLADAAGIVAAGATAARAGEILAARTGAPLYPHAHLSGLRPVDVLVAELLAHTGRPVPDEVRRWRARLADGLLDAHFVLGGARVAVAAEPETLTAVTSLLHDVGADIVTAVAPAPAAVLATAPCEEVVIGDLSDLEEQAAAAGAELVVASSHARAHAARIGAAHLAMGFPVYDRLGAQLRGTGGYRGSLQLLTDAANTLLDHHQDRHPIRTPHNGPVDNSPTGHGSPQTATSGH